MKFSSALLTYLSIQHQCWGVNPSAADISWAASQAKVFIPQEFVVDWREPVEPWTTESLTEVNSHETLVHWFDGQVDNVFRKRRLKSTCDSVTGFNCSPIEESRIEDLLWDQRGLMPDTLYEYRLRKTLLQSPLPESLRLRNGTRLYFRDNSTRIKLSLAKGDAPYLMPLDWQFLVRRLSSEKLSRLLMAVDFAPGKKPVVAPGPDGVFEDHWVEDDLQKYHPIKARRLYAVPEDSPEGRFLQGKDTQNSAFNVWDRQYYTPGQMVRECLPGGGWVCPESEMPDRTNYLLSPRSYSVGVRDDISTGDTTIFGKIMGSIPPGLQVVLNVALERTIGSLRQKVTNLIPANVVVPEFPNSRDNHVAYLLPPQSDARLPVWTPSSLKPYVESDADVLSKLHRDHRTWPHLARALRLDPAVVRRWLYGEVMNSSDLNNTTMNSKTSTGKRPVALIAYALRLPKLMFRAMTVGALRFAKLYVDLIAKWYTTDGNSEPLVIKQYRNQLDRALHAQPIGEPTALPTTKTPARNATASEVADELPSEKRLELLRLYERLLRMEISPITKSGWEKTQVEWSWPVDPQTAWLTGNEDSNNGLPDDHRINLYGAWTQEGLTSIDGEIHIKPSTVVTDIFIKIGAPLASAIELPDLDIVGFEFKNISSLNESSFRKCLGKYRRGGICDHLNPLWRYRLVSPVFEQTVRLTEAELVRGFPYKRVDMIAFQWANSRPPIEQIEEGVLEPGVSERETKLIPKWLPNSAAATVRLESMRLHLSKRVYSIDEEVLSELIARNIAIENAYSHGAAALQKRAAELRTLILEKAKLRGDLFETDPKEHHVSLVLVPRKSRPAPIAFKDSVPHDEDLLEESEAGWIPRARFRHHVKYWGTVPSRLRYKLKSIGLDRGGLVPRGFQLPLTAQTAPDASLVRMATAALAENRGKPFLSKKGIVVNSDLRKADVFLIDVLIVRDLPVEAPLVSIEQMKKQNLITSFALNEFTEGRLVEETRSLDTEAKDKLLQFLRSRLESKMADLAKTNTATTRPENVASGHEEIVTKTLDPAAITKKHQELTIHPDDENPATSNEEVDTYTARELGGYHRPAPSVVEALRQVAVDQDLTTIVSETLGEVEASVMDLIKDVTLIEITEDPNTGETISRKIQLELNRGGSHTKLQESQSQEKDRTIAFEIPTADENGVAKFVEILVPIKYLRDPGAVSQLIQEKHKLGEEESDRLAEEIVKLVENYEDDDFDALLDVLEDYNRSDLDFF